MDRRNGRAEAITISPSFFLKRGDNHLREKAMCF